MKVKSIAVLLALFVGQLGAHRFYLGATGTGVVMLILTFTLVGIIVSLPWAVIDLVRLLIMTMLSLIVGTMPAPVKWTTLINCSS